MEYKSLNHFERVEVVKFYLQGFGRCLKQLLMDGQWIDELRLKQSQKLTLSMLGSAKRLTLGLIWI